MESRVPVSIHSTQLKQGPRGSLPEESRRCPKNECPDLKMAVTPPGFDDVGQVLGRLGYRYEILPDSQIGTLDLSRFTVLFLNCSSQCFDYAPMAKNALRKYVEVGGSIYASDFAAAYLGEAFPEYFRYRSGGVAGLSRAAVVDRGLKQVLGDSIDLNFDMPDWRIITYLASGHRKYLDSAGMPLLVSFNHGKGQVLYTAFHNHTQPSNKEEILLNFLILKPVVARNSVRFEMLTEDEKKSIQEVPCIARPDKANVLDYWNDKTQALVFTLNWSGQAEFKLSVWNPSGQIVSERLCSNPPCIVRCQSGAPGKWKYQVEVMRSPYPNFPYIVSVGTDKLLQALPSPKC